MQSSLCVLRFNVPKIPLLGGGFERGIHSTSVCYKVQSGRYTPVQGRKQLLTYEMALPPYFIAHKKAWNSWNTTTLLGGKRSQLTTIEDMFIRRFMDGTFFGCILGKQVIIKRQHNIIRIAACIHNNLSSQQLYFLIGFSEELLSIWLQCPVKLELQVIQREQGYVKVI